MLPAVTITKCAGYSNAHGPSVLKSRNRDFIGRRVFPERPEFRSGIRYLSGETTLDDAAVVEGAGGLVDDAGRVGNHKDGALGQTHVLGTHGVETHVFRGTCASRGPPQTNQNIEWTGSSFLQIFVDECGRIPSLNRTMRKYLYFVTYSEIISLGCSIIIQIQNVEGTIWIADSLYRSTDREGFKAQSRKYVHITPRY